MVLLDNRTLLYLTQPSGLPALYETQSRDSWLRQVASELDVLLVSGEHIWADKQKAVELVEAHAVRVLELGVSVPVAQLEGKLCGLLELAPVEHRIVKVRPQGVVASVWESRVLADVLGPLSAEKGESVIDPRLARLIEHQGSLWSVRGDKWRKVSEPQALKVLQAAYTRATPIADPNDPTRAKVPSGAVPTVRLLNDTLDSLKVSCNLPCGGGSEDSLECHSQDLVTGKRLLGASFSRSRLMLDRYDKTHEWLSGHDKSELWHGQRNYQPHKDYSSDWKHTRATLADKAPAFWRFVDDCSLFLLNEPEQRELYQRRVCEMVGQFACGDTLNQKMWLLAGIGGTGKSVLQNLITEIVGGTAATYSTSFVGLGDKYAYANLAGKVFLNITELSSRPSGVGRSDWDEAANTLKAILGGDSREARVKYRQDTPAMKVSVSVVAACNELPSFGAREAEASAWARRMLPIPFRHVVSPEERDINLIEKLKSEIPVIVGATAQLYLRSVWKLAEYAEPQCAIDMLLDSTTSQWECVLDALELHSEGRVAAADCKHYWAGYTQQKLPRNGQVALSKSIQSRFGVRPGKPIQGHNLAGEYKKFRFYEGIRWRAEYDLAEARELIRDGEDLYAEKDSSKG